MSITGTPEAQCKVGASVADVASGKLPREILALTKQEEAWETR